MKDNEILGHLFGSGMSALLPVNLSLKVFDLETKQNQPAFSSYHAFRGQYLSFKLSYVEGGKMRHCNRKRWCTSNRRAASNSVCDLGSRRLGHTSDGWRALRTNRHFEFGREG